MPMFPNQPMAKIRHFQPPSPMEILVHLTPRSSAFGVVTKLVSSKKKQEKSADCNLAPHVVRGMLFSFICLFKWNSSVLGQHQETSNSHTGRQRQERWVLFMFHQEYAYPIRMLILIHSSCAKN